MQLPVINQDEDWITTMEYLESHYGASAPEVNLVECNIYQRGVYIVVEHAGIVYTWENTNSNYCYLDEALHNMNYIDAPERWKTLPALITFKQAIRENSVQAMGLEDIYNEGMTYHHYKDFLRLARQYDRAHHRHETF